MRGYASGWQPPRSVSLPFARRARQRFPRGPRWGPRTQAPAPWVRRLLERCYFEPYGVVGMVPPTVVRVGRGVVPIRFQCPSRRFFGADIVPVRRPQGHAASLPVTWEYLKELPLIDLSPVGNEQPSEV